MLVYSNSIIKNFWHLVNKFEKIIFDYLPHCKTQVKLNEEDNLRIFVFDKSLRLGIKTIKGD